MDSISRAIRSACTELWARGWGLSDSPGRTRIRRNKSLPAHVGKEQLAKEYGTRGRASQAEFSCVAISRHPASFRGNAQRLDFGASHLGNGDAVVFQGDLLAFLGNAAEDLEDVAGDCVVGAFRDVDVQIFSRLFDAEAAVNLDGAF